MFISSAFSSSPGAGWGCCWRARCSCSPAARPRSRGRARDPLTAGFTALLFGVFATALALAGWVNVWVGRAIRAHRALGRTLALGLAVLNLFVLPFGTALAIYAFWVLLHNESRALFEPSTA